MTHLVTHLLGVLQTVWALPLTLSGLALAVLCSTLNPQTCRWAPCSGTAIWISSPLLAWLLRHHPAGRMAAVCVGQVVLANRPLACCPSNLVAHELCHVRQALRWGMLFPFAYLAASLVAACKGQGAYWDNAFERQAREAEKQTPNSSWLA